MKRKDIVEAELKGNVCFVTAIDSVISDQEATLKWLRMIRKIAAVGTPLEERQ